MWLPRDNAEKKEGANALVAVAIDKDKGSQHSLKWAIDNLLNRGQSIVLIHVKVRQQASFSAHSSLPLPSRQMDTQTKDLFLPFRCFCTRKDIHSRDIVLEDTDVAKALIEYVTQSAIQILVMGATSKSSFLRFGKADIPGIVLKGAPDFCTVYVVSKNKISYMRSASRPAPVISPLLKEIMNTQSNSIPVSPNQSTRGSERSSAESPLQVNNDVEFRSPFTRGRRHPHVQSDDELWSEADNSFVIYGRPSVVHTSSSLYDGVESERTPNRLSAGSNNVDYSVESLRRISMDGCPPPEFSNVSSDDGGTASWSSTQQPVDDVEAEMRRLKLELKHTMDMYNNACKEAFTAKQRAMQLQRWKMEEKRRLDEARFAEEAALEVAEKEKAKSRAAIEAAEAAQRTAKLEAQKRITVEMKALKDAEEKRKALHSVAHMDARYRKYTIEEIEAASEFFAESRKIGEGGYGPVYKCYLDHTPVAIKVLRPDAAQGRSQFQQEVEVLSCIRHPNMVLLLGACPEYGCLVYEYMHNGSLDDRLFCRGDTPPLSWQHRFRIAAEIATGLLFLHQTKPEPIVHRDLKPGNILLDRNLVSKISDVGLARLVPPSIADSITQCRMTSTAGTFCYIDPEYQQTGLLGVKSDVYSLGVMLLQIITAKPPMGLTHHMERAIEKGTFKDMLDPAVPDWPVEEALSFAKMALKCVELRRRDRPDLAMVLLPELNRLRALAEESMDAQRFNANEGICHTTPSLVSMRQDVMSCSPSPFESFRSRSSSVSNGPGTK
ncbi:hypothetical protein Nepgr_001018 [Nepenthes gracilis]|uniref:RING-type E3 ubiquitin transferase n=1 Tax=Nepenthes gracilis TaxID=150966 RepID=A0AAD3RWM8_NEPGR|nr:hypothetical protein Nepgr_001018 [Nepenthes gracilis]